MSDFNPYSQTPLPNNLASTESSVRLRLLPPAIGILVTSILHLIGGVSYFSFVSMLLSDPDISAQDTRYYYYLASVVGITMIYAMVLIAGAIGMMRRSSYMWAMITCILALVPLVGPCYVLAIPFGIWGLIALKRPQMREAFKKL